MNNLNVASDLIERIKELEAKEIALIGLQNVVSHYLGGFVAAYDSGNPDALPANREAMIKDVRAVLDYTINMTL